MRDMKIRILDDSKIEDVDLWLASGSVRVSRTALMNILFEEFHTEVTGQDSTLENIATGVHNAVKIGRIKADNERFGTTS